MQSENVTKRLKGETKRTYDSWFEYSSLYDLTAFDATSDRILAEATAALYAKDEACAVRRIEHEKRELKKLMEKYPDEVERLRG